MKWVERTPEPIDGSFLMEDHKVRLSVDMGDEPWQHFSLNFSVLAKKGSTSAECLDSWPRQAIAEARRRLDDFEAKLKKEAE